MSRVGELKSDIINRAFSKLRISGLTKLAGSADLALALDALENLAEEYKDRGVCVNYNFEDSPDSGSLHNLHRKYWHAFSVCLAVRLISDFGKGQQDKLDPKLITDQRAAFSFLLASTANVRQVQPSSRMPIGSGNNNCGYYRQNFNYPVARVPNDCDSESMVYDEVDDYVEHFDAYLNDGETIDSYTIIADTGLTIDSDSNTDVDVLYRITADGNSTTSPDSLLQIVITITTTDTRVKVRTVNFEITEE